MNNIPAFPAQALGGLGYTTGMTLLDYFAAKTIQGMLASGNLPKSVSDEELAMAAYQLATAMMKQREA